MLRIRHMAVVGLASLSTLSSTAAGELKHRFAVDRERTDEGAALRDGTLEARAGGETYTSPWFRADFPFNEVLISWNVDVPEKAGFAVALRFEHGGEGEVAREGEKAASAWYHLGRFGGHPGVEGVIMEDGGGKVEIDCFRAKGLYRMYQYRVSLAGGNAGNDPANGGTSGLPRIQRVSVIVSNTTGDRTLHEKHARRPGPPPPYVPLRLDVPFRSQQSEDATISGRICSPTSVAMVMAYRGVDRPTAEVAARAFDSDHDIYGNWPANVQAAYSFGLRGRLARFRSWDDAREKLAAGQPIVISIRDPEGVLRNAPYRKTDGHLLVLCGFDEHGNPCVNDPAAPDAARGLTVYDREQMERVWLDQGGLGYLIEGPARKGKR